MFRNLLIKLKNWLVLKTGPRHDELVSYLIMHTASLALMKTEFVEFAPLCGVCGVIKLSGNSLPVFEYLIFDKKAPMEFIKIRVEVAKPDRIKFISQIQSTDPQFDGKFVETKEWFKEPFNQLLHHLYCYFPFTRSGQINPSKIQESQVSNVL